MLHAIVSGINYCHFLRNRINPLMVINVTCHQYIHTFFQRYGNCALPGARKNTKAMYLHIRLSKYFHIRKIKCFFYHFRTGF